jgi:hypothetical protein
MLSQDNGLDLHPVRRFVRNRLAFRIEMVSAAVQMGAAVCGNHLRHPGKLLLAEAVKRLPAATVYATFVGIGTAGTAIVGMAFFRESTNFGRICSLLLIAAGLIGLRVFSAAE